MTLFILFLLLSMTETDGGPLLNTGTEILKTARWARQVKSVHMSKWWLNARWWSIDSDFARIYKYKYKYINKTHITHICNFDNVFCEYIYPFLRILCNYNNIFANIFIYLHTRTTHTHTYLYTPTLYTQAHICTFIYLPCIYMCICVYVIMCI